MSVIGVRCLLMVLLAATAAAEDTMSGLLTQVDCETSLNDSVTYRACVAGPEHILAPGISPFNITLDPPDSTCGDTPQESCTLVCITVLDLVVASCTGYVGQKTRPLYILPNI